MGTCLGYDRETRGLTQLLQVMLIEGSRLPLHLHSPLEVSSSSWVIQESRETFFSWSSSYSTHQPVGSGAARAQDSSTLVLPNASHLKHGPVSVAASLAALDSHLSATSVLLQPLYPDFSYNMGQFSSETFFIGTI